MFVSECLLSVNEIIEDHGNLTVYGLTEHRFLDSLDSLGLDWLNNGFLLSALEIDRL